MDAVKGLEHGFKKTRGGTSGVKSGVGSTGPSEEEQGLGPGYKKTRGGSLGLKSGGESAGPSGEEQGLGPGYKKTRGGSSGLKSGGESAGLSGEEQGLGHGFKKIRSGGSSVKSGGESAGLSGEEQGQGHGFKKIRGGGSSVKSGGESAGLSGEEQGLGPGYKKTRGGGSSVKSSGENSGPIGEEQKVEEDSEQFKDNTPDQSFQLRSQDEERSPLPTPSSMDGPSSGSTSTLLSPTPIQPKVSPMTASAIERLESSTRPLSSHIYKRDSDSIPVVSTFKDWKDEFLTQKQEEAFREYFKFFCDAGEIDVHSLKNILSIVGISRTSAEMVEALMSADVNCDGHVDFRDFLTVLTDTQRFCRSVEQHTNPSSNGRNPHTLLFEVLSQLIEMLALPENFMEEITNYYQKKMKGMSRYKESPVTASRQPHPHKRTFSRTSDITPHEQKVINIVDRIKRQNHSTFLQSPYSIQGANHSLCPRLDRKITRRKQGSHVILEEYKPIDLTTDFRTFFQMGPKGVRDLNPTLRKWLTSMSSRTH
ncbi:spermatogenesis-associated protein 21 [Gracilinanus agilis]|uniref:spermatogenesis-associated protein 21 n=1 Tax=Gracilinanus agilis TaxID=191870 RepID=UPI001CFC5BC9|nr:spermatogenesis-associated protein 21 [Gracilinanus agilis]